MSKVKKSAILEHLLDLERQIRRELARASLERQAMAGNDDGGAVPGDEAVDKRRKKPVPTEIAQRYLH